MLIVVLLLRIAVGAVAATDEHHLQHLNAANDPLQHAANHHSHHAHRQADRSNEDAATGDESLSHQHRWMRTESMDPNGLYVLDWRLQGREIYFRITANTRGFVGLGFSLKSGRMADADLVVAWVDDRTGKPNVLVSGWDGRERERERCDCVCV